MEQIRTQLVSDVNADSFADMCAQTLVYGMLSSRVTNPKDFGSSPIFSTVPVANPFLEALFEQVHDEAVSLDLPGSDLPQLVADLRQTNVEAILDQIDSTIKGGDPVIHFYEEFLKQYDRKMRADAGAFYTPQPAVEFIVRAVDEVLRTRFGLPMGIADADALAGGCRAPRLRGARGRRSRQAVRIDGSTRPPAPARSWWSGCAGPASRSWTPALPANGPSTCETACCHPCTALELMLAPYAIAHLKVALELHMSGAGDGAMQILLTDTLEHAAPPRPVRHHQRPRRRRGREGGQSEGVRAVHGRDRQPALRPRTARRWDCWQTQGRRSPLRSRKHRPACSTR